MNSSESSAPSGASSKEAPISPYTLFIAGLGIAGLIGLLDQILLGLFSFMIPSYVNIVFMPLLLLGLLWILRGARGWARSWKAAFWGGFLSSLGFVCWSLALSLFFLLKNQIFEGLDLFLVVSLVALLIQIPVTALFLKWAGSWKAKPAPLLSLPNKGILALVLMILLGNFIGESLLEDSIYASDYFLEQAELKMTGDEVDALRDRLGVLFCDESFQNEVSASYFFYSSIYSAHSTLVKEMGSGEPGSHEIELHQKLNDSLEAIESLANDQLAELDLYRAFLLQVDSGEMADLTEKFESERALLENKVEETCPGFLETEDSSTVLTWGVSLIFYGSGSAEYFNDLRFEDYLALKYPEN